VREEQVAAELPQRGLGGAAAGRTGNGPPFALAIVALFGFAAVAFVHRGMVFGSDQALFLDYAAALRSGGVLYVDVWDNKQPGIFWLYALANLLFGDGWHGVRVGYALWLGAAGAAVAALLRFARPRSPAWIWGPIFTVGVLSLRTDSDLPAQIEVLTGLPLATLLLLCATLPASPQRRSLRWLAAGAVAAGLALLKLVLLPVAAAIVCCALAWHWARRDLAARDLLRAAFAMGAGAALALMPVAVHFWWHGAMAEFLWTTFEYPRLAVREIQGQRPEILVAALRWLFMSTAGLLPAAMLALWSARGRWRTREGLLTLACAAWAASALGVIVLQRFSWWPYHMAMVVWPIGVLAALGLSSRPAGERRLGGVATGIAAAFLMAHVAWFGAKVLRSPDWPLDAASTSALETARRVAAAANAPCRSIYAIGDYPGVVDATGLRQALPTQGVFPGAWLPAQVQRMPQQLADVRPDLVYVDPFMRERLQLAHPGFFARIDAWLADDYVHRATDEHGGNWWERRGERGGGDCVPRPRFRIPESTPRQ